MANGAEKVFDQVRILQPIEDKKAIECCHPNGQKIAISKHREQRLSMQGYPN